MLILVGSNHRSAPVEVRERMSFPLEQISEAHERILQFEEVAEALILSTCNRVEILIRSDRSARDGAAALRRFLADQHKLSLHEVEEYTYQLSGNDAVKHLFSVACGLDSMIMGEPQILGQVKQAYQLAREHGTLGPVLDRLLQHCLSAAKKVRTETGISRHAVSVAFAAVELARKIFGDLGGRKALLLGAGKMGVLVARHLVGNGVAELIVCSRTYGNAVVQASNVGGRAIQWDEGVRGIGQVDIVISCTGATKRVLSKADLARAMRGRKLGPLFVIDIAVPRDVDPRANEIDGVYLYDIDALQGVVDANIADRRQAAQRAKQMIARESAAFQRWRDVQEITPIIVSLRNNLLEVGRFELERFRRRLDGLSDKQRQVVEELTRAVIQKILHRPIRHLRGSVERGDMAECAMLYREIFGMESESGRSAADGPELPEKSGPQRLIEGGKDG